MKELLEKIYGRKVDSFHFIQEAEVYNKKYQNGEIYESEVTAYEPSYKVSFMDQATNETILISELFDALFKLKKIKL